MSTKTMVTRVAAMALWLSAAGAAAQSAPPVRAETTCDGSTARLDIARPCGTDGSWCGAGSVDLGEATSAGVVLLFDLDGPGFSRVPRAAVRRDRHREIRDASHPAALIRTENERNDSSLARWVLVSLSGNPRVLWDFVASRSPRGRHGRPDRRLRMVRLASNQPLEIQLEREPVRTPDGEAPPPPGPPLRFRMGPDGQFHSAR